MTKEQIINYLSSLTLPNWPMVNNPAVMIFIGVGTMFILSVFVIWFSSIMNRSVK